MPPDDPFALVGTILDRNVRIDGTVAEGGFGIVYIGYHLALGTPVAIKVLRPVPGFGPDAWADAMGRFVDEARAIARVRHPAVVRVLNSGIAPVAGAPGGVPWMVLEWIEGETLRAHLATRRGADGRAPAEALALLRPVLEAVATAHEAGLVHRDLKPSNVILERGGHARVVDFGTAKLLGDEPRTPSGETATEETTRAFSAISAAPEQLAGTRTGPWTDVYALGLMLTEVLCDRPPYPETDAAARYAAAFDTHRRPTPAYFGIDVGGWEGVLTRALAVRPADRQASAGQLLLELERSFTDEPGAPRDDLVARRPFVSPPATQSSAPRAGISVATGGGRVGAPADRELASPKKSRGVLSVVAVTLASAAALGATLSRWAWRGEMATPRAVTAASADAPSCTGHAVCRTRAGGAPAACKLPEGRCFELATAECSVLADERALAADDTLWFGTLFPMTGVDAAEYGLGNVHAVDLARRDFVETISGAAARRSDDSARPFGVVACDDEVAARKAAEHLADVGVVAVIGFKDGVEAIDLVSSVFAPNRVLSLSATSANPLVTRIPRPAGEPRRIYRTTHDANKTAATLAAVLRAEPRPAEGLRVALVRRKSAQEAAFAESTSRELGLPPGQFRDLSFDAEAEDADAQYAAVARAIVAFAPHAIVFSGAGAAVRGVIAPVERAWPTGVPRPRWASVSTIGSGLLELIGTDRGLGRRVLGVAPVANSPVNARFVAHYVEAFPGEHVTLTDNPNTAYDAFYLLAYASYAAGPARPDGDALARAFATFRAPARPIEVGIAGIFDAFGELSAGRGVDLYGATGHLALDPVTGEAPFDQAILCVEFDASGRAVGGVESGAVWSASERKLRGRPQCK